MNSINNFNILAGRPIVPVKRTKSIDKMGNRKSSLKKRSTIIKVKSTDTINTIDSSNYEYNGLKKSKSSPTLSCMVSEDLNPNSNTISSTDDFRLDLSGKTLTSINNFINEDVKLDNLKKSNSSPTLSCLSDNKYNVDSSDDELLLDSSRSYMTDKSRSDTPIFSTKLLDKTLDDTSNDNISNDDTSNDDIFASSFIRQIIIPEEPSEFNVDKSILLAEDIEYSNGLEIEDIIGNSGLGKFQKELIKSKEYLNSILQKDFKEVYVMNSIISSMKKNRFRINRT
jgi:hypothetical protein